MFRDKTIRKGVMKIVDARIEKAQKAYDDHVKIADAAHEVEVNRLHKQKEDGKIVKAQQLVGEILGKII